ncbi:hypothetical protein HLH34_13665 [Gluconacetobacter azotocaptans]|uniref:Uncharacterized protein n=1 Tax=Gluconacetobacter azotocaptans TaxID=142834 RepID=A0A7W4PEV4_9PROT|nr:hypothetical protein [Gluconacetobacter azotocaptans]MBB2190995.1 hypothetical protein [Gluconacetobacter azotocaptans]MBM9401917.1 hypothetical protein [Gluconacetobacter azotocaptans]GBQ29596.1 hypothetical protein AA13594_1418 [Gluconacetobacter azotocaptans DSM 13594]
MGQLFDNVFPNGHKYREIPWEITNNPLVIVEIVETARRVMPEAIDVIAGLVHRLDSREIALQHICSPGPNQSHP